jgi:hypothetical protein
LTSCDSLGFLESDRDSVTMGNQPATGQPFRNSGRDSEWRLAGDSAVHRPVKVNTRLVRPPRARRETLARRHVAPVRSAGGEWTLEAGARNHLPSASRAAARIVAFPCVPAAHATVGSAGVGPRVGRANVAAFSDTPVAIGATGSWNTCSPSDPTSGGSCFASDLSTFRHAYWESGHSACVFGDYY